MSTPAQIYIKVPNERAISWNEMYAGVHWSVRRKLVIAKHQIVRAALDPDLAQIDWLVDVVVEATFTSKPLDSDNVPAKLYIDSLRPRILADDDNRYVRYVSTRAQLGSEDMIEIWLIPVEEDRDDEG